MASHPCFYGLVLSRDIALSAGCLTLNDSTSLVAIPFIVIEGY